jgi:hypothetical protein
MTARGAPIKIYTGNANPELAANICHILGVPLGKAKVGKFSNGETAVEIEVRFMLPFVLPTSSLYIFPLVLLGQAETPNLLCKHIK